MVALLLCMLILLIAIIEKFAEGDWSTLFVTTVLIVLCMLSKRHCKLKKHQEGYLQAHHTDHAPDPQKSVAFLTVGPYGSLGEFSALSLFYPPIILVGLSL
ncbi:hypothetical protein [Pajaroellobacter abortibovis]|uniref:Uncharacterized protein n=1 Tax=Pajaroellobacter abortibovis TaxID=1882918 RepID=A0A1L6MYA2_9BACT|nr:hypothetical protein [Pajaroellobacter abortibovis]APS00510.1 hypothetical protein BCY86_07345 [Pajaroellobacter abortibovis]